MKKLRILHVTFDMAIGGTEQVIRQLVLNLPTDEFDNEIFCIDGKIGAVGAQLQQQGIRIHQAARKAGLDFDLIKTLRQTLRSGDFDVVHCHQYTPWVYGWFAAWGCKAKVVFTEHGRFFPDRSRGKALPLNVLMALTTSAITAISSATRDALVTYEAIPRFKIDVIYNGIVDVAAAVQSNTILYDLGIPDNSIILGTIARLDPIKNQIMMIDAFSIVAVKVPNSYLLVVGDGPARTELEEHARVVGISSNIRFVGFKTNVADYLSVFDIYLLSSRTEGTSMTLLEAMAMELPCVVTQVGGNPEIIINGSVGFLSPDDNKYMFAENILELVRNPELRDGFAKNARARYMDVFHIERMVNSYICVYKN